ncbi:EAL domain-containing protein [Candidatus Ferrigenium straubiae]|jgi:diguanylate cyclase (GGDEF)-like protein/PAS domain S-box-containing protein|uniref:EAL domain-containing protein n=1 Tax=Candidatus Ferrigenium straubiae TaxID=2919506 RepID=UPI003F4AF5DF
MTDNRSSKKILQAFFSPAVTLMNRLDVARKFVLLGLMSLVAIAVVVYSLFAKLEQDISFGQRELKGLKLIELFPRTVHVLQQHRGLSAGLLGGDGSMRDSRAGAERQVVEALNEMSGQVFSGMNPGEDLQHIKADWERLRKEGLSWTAAENFAAHTRLIARIQSFEGMVADEYALTLDPELSTFYLIDTIVNKLPHALEHLGRLRAYGTGVLAKKQASEQQKIEMSILIAKLDDAISLLKANLDKTGRHNPALQDVISTASRDIADSARQVAGLVTSDILSGRFATQPDAFSGMSTVAIDRSYSQLYEKLLPMAETLIRERIERAESTVRFSVGTAFLLFLVAAYFSVGISRAIIVNIRSLARSAHAFADGSLHERVSIDTRDELGQVGDSFNEMAFGFRTLLEASRENEARLRDLSENLEERVKKRTMELEQAQQLTESLLRRNQALMTTSMDGIHIMDTQGNLLAANDAFCRMLGYTQDEVAGLNVADWDAQWPIGELRVRFRGLIGGSSRFETLHRRKDGVLINVEISASGVALEGQEFIYASSRDITGRKRYEEVLKRHKLVIDTAIDGFWMTDMRGNLQEANEAYAKISGYTVDELVNMNISKLEAKEQSAEEVRAHIAKIMAQGYERFETCHHHKDGHEIDIEVSATYMAESQQLFVFCHDITKRKKAEEALRIAAATFETHEAILITDANANIVRVNRAFEETTGYSAEEVLGKNPRILSSGRQDKAFYAEMWQQLLETGSWTGEMWDRRKNGQVYPKWLTITAIKNERGETTEYVAIFSDITARKEAEEEIRNLAFYDALTKLPNRRLLLDRFHLALSVSARSHHYGAVLFLDMDKFKVLNDTLGHDHGDLMLVEVAERIQFCVREVDTVARLGGDEFVVLIEEIGTNAQDASQKVALIAEKIRAALSVPYQIKGHEHHSSPSIGVCLYRGSEQSVDTLLKHADLAMYQAKEAGRNTVRFFDPAMQHAVELHAALEADLRRAVPNGELRLFYQIQVDSEHHPLGAEALVRWEHPRRGMVSPVQFIPVAEESSLILDIGHWVLDTACRQLAQWGENERMRHLTVAINVSAQQFRLHNFVDKIATALHTHHIDPSRLKLELTESVVLNDVTDVVTKMHALKALGVQLSLDDFGTGYSSLSYLKKLPLDQLKIDQSFVRDLATDPNDAVMVQTIIDMAQNFRMGVIAEGVETEAQLGFLKQNGCMTYQGYLFGKPLPVGEFEALLGKLRGD